VGGAFRWHPQSMPRFGGHPRDTTGSGGRPADRPRGGGRSMLVLSDETSSPRDAPPPLGGGAVGKGDAWSVCAGRMSRPRDRPAGPGRGGLPASFGAGPMARAVQD